MMQSTTDQQQQPSIPTLTLNKSESLDTATSFLGYIEVTAVEDESGHLRDEIMVVYPWPPSSLLLEEEESDPLYYYPPSTPDSAKLESDEDDSDTDSESDDEEDYDAFSMNGAGDDDDIRPMVVISNTHGQTKTVGTPTTTSDQGVTVINTTTTTTATTRTPEYSFMEEFLSTLDTIFGCSYTQCVRQEDVRPILKSVLRRKLSQAPLPPQIDRNVSFTRLEIKEFNMTLGNHPSAVTGPPVMLDAKPTREHVIDMESYEKARQPRRTRKQLKLTFEARRGILENDRGFTVSQVKEAWSEALMIRKQRQETRQRTPQQQLWDEVYESAVRKANRLVPWQQP